MLEKALKCAVTKLDQREREDNEEFLVYEYPLTIFFNNRELVTLLCTPTKLEALAVGFLKTEGLIDELNEILSLRIQEDKGVVEITTKMEKQIEEKLYSKRLIPTGCGSCGKGGLFFNVIDSIKCKPVSSDLTLEANKVYAFMEKNLNFSELFKLTGGVHTVGLSDENDLLLACEDVARHNALDKVIGDSLLQGISLKDKIIIISGRVSSEMLLKAAKMDIPIVISKSVPTHLAVEMAKELNVALVGYVRDNKMKIYSHGWRVK